MEELNIVDGFLCRDIENALAKADDLFKDGFDGDEDELLDAIQADLGEEFTIALMDADRKEDYGIAENVVVFDVFTQDSFFDEGIPCAQIIFVRGEDVLLPFDRVVNYENNHEFPKYYFESWFKVPADIRAVG